MKFFKKYIGDLFIPLRFYLATGCCILLFIFSFFISPLIPIASGILYIFLFIVFVDYFVLFLITKAPYVKRIISDRLSNGDDNKVTINIKNRMHYTLQMEIIDELPVQFQERNFILKKNFAPKNEQNIFYTIKPVQRGEYEFGTIILYVKTPLSLLMRRYVADEFKEVSVYPSFLHLKAQQLISHTSLVNEYGSKKLRKIGHSMEFEQIKDYVTGDDIRSINWKATARKGLLMINNYADEKSQQVYCVIDKGRLMKMPFNGLSLLDYAINSSLVMANVCLQKQDKIGLITFANKMGNIIAADRKPVQRENILQVLYRQTTAFMESDFEMLYMQIRNKIKQRSLLILYTNFESLSGLRRQLNYLRSIARHHLLLVVFFENTELSTLARADAKNLEDVYVKTIADKFAFEKRLIVKELQKYGILSILTPPENLTLNTVNKYLELKARRAL